MKIKSARRITPEPSRCIEVDSPDRLFAAGGKNGQSFLSHNSVVQRNVVLGCILRPQSWRFLGIDLKKVELSTLRAYSNVVLGIATTLEDALTVLRFAQQTMMKRYEELETLGLNNFLDLPEKGQALLVMVDEAGELLGGSSGVKAISEDTYIPNLNGRRNISEIQKGDIVFNSSGKYTTVEDKYIPDRQEQFDLVLKNSYSVSSGTVTQETIRTGADHYWVVVNSKNGEEKTLTTRVLFEEMSLTSPNNTWKIRKLSGSIENQKQELQVSPFALGQHLSFNTILDEKDFMLLDGGQGIPDRYLYSSVEQRKDLLNGIFGFVKTFTTNDLYLVQDIQRVISSLGFSSVLKKVDEGVEITYTEESSEWFEIDSLIPVDEDKWDEKKLYCLKVDSEDSQFLCTENFVPTHNTDEGKEQDQLKGEASMIIGSIARLGRAAGVHLLIATQRPDATLIPGETKANLGVRINCGNSGSTMSSMILENGEGTRVKPSPRGRLYMQIYGKGDHGQGFFADPNWIDEYLAKQGLNPDGTPLNQKKSRLAKLTDFDSEFGEGVDLDSKEGVDNSEAIEKIRQEEENEDWGFEEEGDGVIEDDETFSEQELDQPTKTTGSKWGGLELGKGEKKSGRPEDDWDSDFDSLVEENFEN